MSGILSAIGGGLLHLVLPSLGTILAGLAVSFVQKKAAQAGIDLTQAQTNLLKTQVTNAVQAVEEISQKNPTTITGQEKHAMATSMVAAVAPTASPTQVDTLINAVLQDVRPARSLARVPPQSPNA